jgi:hypothetical protein
MVTKGLKEQQMLCSSACPKARTSVNAFGEIALTDPTPVSPSSIEHLQLAGHLIIMGRPTQNDPADRFMKADEGLR